VAFVFEQEIDIAGRTNQIYPVEYIGKGFTQFLVHKGVFGYFNGIKIHKRKDLRRQIVDHEIQGILLLGKNLFEESVMGIGDLWIHIMGFPSQNKTK
jgi:hypothetical protein